jgi:hypothetical protein
MGACVSWKRERLTTRIQDGQDFSNILVVLGFEIQEEGEGVLTLLRLTLMSLGATLVRHFEKSA